MFILKSLSSSCTSICLHFTIPISIRIESEILTCSLEPQLIAQRVFEVPCLAGILERIFSASFLFSSTGGAKELYAIFDAK